MTENREECDGFSFMTKKEAELARVEYENIQIMKERVDMTNPKQVYDFYQKMTHNKLMKTPVGYCYLRELREILKIQYHMADVDLNPIPVYDTMVYIPAQKKQEASLLADKLRKKNHVLTFAIIGLFCAILAMFVITGTNPNVGYINTENKILNKYSKWEEELNQREEELNKQEEAANSGK